MRPMRCDRCGRLRGTPRDPSGPCRHCAAADERAALDEVRRFEQDADTQAGRRRMRFTLANHEGL